MKIKKKTIVLISIIAILLLSIIVKLSTDFYKENKLKEEIKEIVRLINTNPENNEKIDELLNRTVIKKGKYNIVETSLKKYYKELYSDYSNLLFIIDDENFTNYLSETSLRENRPSFINTKNNIENTYNQIDALYTEVENEVKEISIKLPYISEYNLSTYYKELYLSLIDDNLGAEFINNLDKKQKFNKFIQENKAKDKLAIYEEAIQYLSTYNNEWSIKNGVIEFKDMSYKTEYEIIMNKLKEVE